MRDTKDLIAKLPRTPENRRLIDNLIKLKGLRSVEFDLRRCLHALSMLQDRVATRDPFVRSPLPHQEAIIDASLASYLIITYCKCTDTSSHGRSQFNPRRFLTEDQKISHRELVALRNQAVAHFGPGSHGGGEWAFDRLLIDYTATNHEIELLASMSRANFRASAIIQLAELLPVVLAGVYEVINKREAEIKKMVLSRPDILALIGTLPSVARPAEYAEYNGGFSGTPLGGWTS